MDTVFVFSSPMAQYAFAPGLNRSRKVIDFVDVDSDKWAQYALERSGPIAWIYNREARLLSKFEQDAAHRFDVSIFVSDAEADLFRTRLPGDHTNVIAVPNGVDADYFSPNHHFPSPFRNGESPVVFVGAMDYWPNVDAVLWFKQAILPTVLQAVANARFYIVGAKPAPSVTRLAGTDTVVTARVEDVRPYVANAAVVIAPMRIARGVQNKVLEGMALGKPVVTTSKGLEGIVALPNREVLVADSADSFAGAVIRTLLTPNLAMGDAARARVVADYSWDSAWERLRPHLGG
jgi:sugar transferase (PEP-CTERM/EpsH1 system associated)